MDRDQSHMASSASARGDELPATVTAPIVSGVTQGRKYEIVYIVKSTHTAGANMRIAQ